MSKLTEQIKELTGEDAVDIFGGDAENIVEELNETNKNKEEIEPNAFDENGNLIKIKWS